MRVDLADTPVRLVTLQAEAEDRGAWLTIAGDVLAALEDAFPAVEAHTVLDTRPGHATTASSRLYQASCSPMPRCFNGWVTMQPRPSRYGFAVST